MIQYPTIVYHGTTSKHEQSLANGINFSKCDLYTDFGLGFYVTENQKQAIKFAKDQALNHNISQSKRKSRNASFRPTYVTGTVFVYQVNESWLNSLNGRHFQTPDDIWRKFVYNNRISIPSMRFLEVDHNQFVPAKYDIVYGPLADGAMANLTLVESDQMSVVKFMETVVSIGSQISIHTDNAKEGLTELPGRRIIGLC
jgi:hypothetical protein